MPRFVVLEHYWNGVHWDFMLEAGDVLRTWAVDARIEPGVALPARALGDHRRAYLDYVGEVSGGRGFVRRWDEGNYEPLVWTPELVQVRLEGAQLVGVLELRRAVGMGEAGRDEAWGLFLRKAD